MDVWFARYPRPWYPRQIVHNIIFPPSGPDKLFIYSILPSKLSNDKLYKPVGSVLQVLSEPDLVDVDVLLGGVVAVGHAVVTEDHHIDVSETFIR